MAELMETLAKKQDGFISMASARNDTSTTLSGAVGITVSYWESLEAIQDWKQQTDHITAQQKGIKDWYNWYNVRICKVEREYEFKK
jgi:heme-degrading monooxygenase HmoA